MPGVIKINPETFKDKRDALAVAWNEALRLFMEDTGFEPRFAVTPEQASFFKDTAYAQDEGSLRKTLAARIATRDTSVPAPTPEQVAETGRLLDAVLKKIGPYHKDARAVKLMKGGLPAAPAPSAPPEPTPRSAPAPVENSPTA